MENTAPPNILPVTLVEYFFNSGIFGYGAVLFGGIALALLVKNLFLPHCWRSYLATTALGLTSLFCGAAGSLTGMITVFYMLAINPTANVWDFYGGMYMVPGPAVFALLLGGPAIVLSLLAIALRYKPQAAQTDKEEALHG